MFNKFSYFKNTFILFSYVPIFLIALNFADLDGGFNFNSWELGTIGFLCLSRNCGVYYKCSNYRDEKSETTIKWDDKFLNIKWPIKKPILSKKDKAGLSFDQFIKL